VCAILLGVNVRQAAGQDAWFTLYDDGVKAYKSGNDSVAEEKLLAALNHRLAPRTQRRRSVVTISQQRVDFLPEYYLALVYVRTGRYSDALAYAKQAEAHIRANDAEFATLTGARDTAAGALKTADAERLLAEQRRQFEQLMTDAEQALSAKRFADARQTAARARALGTDPTAVDALTRRIETADLGAQVEAALAARSWSQATTLVDRLATLKAPGPQVQVYRTAVARGLAEDDGRRLEREGLIAFYRGEYASADRALSQVSKDVSTPRVAFYLACSRAALALLDGSSGADRLRAAKTLYASAQPTQPGLQADRRYVSPVILDALER
jgi:hypothetical protein